MTNRVVVNNSDGSNSYLNLRPYSRLYCAYKDNTNSTTWTEANQPTKFPASSTPWEIWRNQDFQVDESNCKMTYVGDTPRWFRISAVCNALKSTGSNTDRLLNFQWYLNGVAVGHSRETHMNNKLSEIVSGTGQLYMSNGDYIQPYCWNSDNADQALFKSCTFDIVEEPSTVVIWS